MKKDRRTPTSPEVWYRLGTMQLHAGRFADAAQSLRQALADRPDMAAAWHNLACACHKQSSYEEAITCYRRALLFCPDDQCTLNNLGVLLRETGRLTDSLLLLEQLVKSHPDDADAHWNLALSLLTAGRYEDGWSEYEWRFRRSRPVTVTDPGSPRWQGEPLEGKHILLCCEQAYGDSIQFIRFAAQLSDWGATVTVLCPDSSLAGLLSRAPGITTALSAGQPLPPHDCWSPLLSLPYYLDIQKESLPPAPYLFGDNAPIAELGLESRLKVGLVWSGRATDPHRACPAELFARLSHYTDRIAFYSLQMNADQQDLDILTDRLGITALSPIMTEFSATARVMQQLDLIISIDSAPAHLAGALGCETWLLLQHIPDWRWGIADSSSVWYPSMRLFRQPAPGDWQSVITRLETAVEQLISGNSATINLNRAPGLMALADQLREQEQWSAAHHLYRLAAERDPDSSQARLCAGGCLIFLNRPNEAIRWLEEAIRLQPEDPDAHINLGLALLSCSSFNQAWREFDWRCCNIHEPLPPIPNLPPIGPNEPLQGKTVLVHCEQGYGDMLQFARYLPILAKCGACVIVSLPQAMLRLFTGISGIDRLVPHGELLPDADFQVPLLSLPERLSQLVSEIPCNIPYLSPDSKLQAHWHALLSGDTSLRVGLVWRGSDLRKSGYRRSLSVDLLTSLTQIENISLYSLQIGALPEELAKLPGIIDMTPQLTDFADTAAAISQLDLLISVDTSTAHLAGALGIRCWVPLLFSPDWRWYPLQEQGSRWYPTTTVFRQPIPGKWEPVIEAIASALQGEALLHLGHKQGRAGNLSRAIAAFQQATELPVRSVTALLNLGIYLRADGKLQQACTALQQAVEHAPDYAEAWQNLGMVQQGLGRLPEAYTCLQHALRLRPDYETARWNLGLLQLLLGEYTAGFRNFEARFSKVGAVARLHTNISGWDGSPLAGRRILIHAEQGYGDTLQFIRFIPLLADQGADVIFEVQDQSLAELCSSVNGVSQIIVRGEPVPGVDCQCPLLSLPHLLGSTINTIPHKVPYLSADKEKVALWQERLPRDSRRKIGICWKGRPTPDPFRSVPFEQLAPLWDLPEICWVSLQLDHDPVVRPAGIIELTDRIENFADTAALVSCLDLIISIDSAVAHLAGALGVPGIVMLPFAPDWRWTHDKLQSPWYPSLQLVRQAQPSNWQEAIQELTCRIRAT